MACLQLWLVTALTSGARTNKILTYIFKSDKIFCTGLNVHILIRVGKNKSNKITPSICSYPNPPLTPSLSLLSCHSCVQNIINFLSLSWVISVSIAQKCQGFFICNVSSVVWHKNGVSV
jgi:hypothetical protein